MREQRQTSGSVSYLPALASCALSSKIPQPYPSFPSVLTPPAPWRSPLPGKSLLNFWDLAQVAGISAIFLIPTVALAYFVLSPPSPRRVPFADSYEAHAVFCGRFLFTCLLHPLWLSAMSIIWQILKEYQEPSIAMGVVVPDRCSDCLFKAESPVGRHMSKKQLKN